MINITIWYEKLQEMTTPDYRFVKIPEDKREEVEKYHAKRLQSNQRSLSARTWWNIERLYFTDGRCVCDTCHS